MKNLLLLFVFSLFGRETPDKNKLYIVGNIDGTFEFIQFLDHPDSLISGLTSKAPGQNYDFFSDYNLIPVKRNIREKKMGQTVKYRQKGDSIFFTSIVPPLIRNYSGVYKQGILYFKTVYIFNAQVVKTTPNQIYRPY